MGINSIGKHLNGKQNIIGLEEVLKSTTDGGICLIDSYIYCYNFYGITDPLFTIIDRMSSIITTMNKRGFKCIFYMDSTRVSYLKWKVNNERSSVILF
jgi:hypothetical protein